ncbi:tRNA dimethylallyltransferase [Spizellomyces punctatus DAOM BR117]|uniref:tRNA dimethylallyltransferase n=1 Tax=Spizellomyces punctatus (strain DAOM BR117) TaxID=645134 RepID=A0A0L0HS53_SPIPD|nr:tRNA dimethylallyltransferase [Spizellomyces punctatus DAOM BR117]KND04186.1 tRNA dimethylallyltransferase [Spizellomyces punctatus DAOM BR117]|eukprot:XP_016612225.1 tRNA dimethylallyltransferase [Spizellomyces punctatus DAOM BR117]
MLSFTRHAFHTLRSMTHPLLVVVGTTGVGKSQLGIELAKALNGEVVNADSMQVYKGLDIATNKATTEERDGIPHHLMDFVDPSREYSVSEFQRDALQVISQIHSRGHTPILVGGTNYYIQSLLWRESIIASASEPDLSAPDIRHESLASHPLADRMARALDATDPKRRSMKEIAEFVGTNELAELVSCVDPVMAERWHPNEDRKLRRSLQIFYTTGKPHSEWIAEQQASTKDTLRFKTCIFWLYADPPALYPRLDKRVDEMIKLGLFPELLDMRKKLVTGQVIGTPTQDHTPYNYTRGILQAIGFKEFDTYFSHLESPGADTDVDSLCAQGIENMKRATRQYARRQVTWIKNKLATRCFGVEGVEFFLLDASSLDGWNQTIRDPAIQIAKDFLENKPTPSPHTLTPLASTLLPTHSKTPQWKKQTCPVCVDRDGKPRVLNGSLEWDVHVQTRGHRLRMQKMDQVV